MLSAFSPRKLWSIPQDVGDWLPSDPPDLAGRPIQLPLYLLIRGTSPLLHLFLMSYHPVGARLSSDPSVGARLSSDPSVGARLPGDPSIGARLPGDPSIGARLPGDPSCPSLCIRATSALPTGQCPHCYQCND